MPVVLLTAAAGTLAAGGSVALWNLFRRETKRWKEKDLPENVFVPREAGNDSTIHVVRKLSGEDRIALKTAFLSGCEFQWIVSGHASQGLGENDKALHRTLTFYAVECVLQFAEEYGHVLAARDPKTQEYLGSICLIPPYSSSQKRNLHFLWTVIQHGVPPPMNKETKARFNSFQKILEEQHMGIMKTTPHWQIINLGVVPNAQGRGLGTQLLQAALEIADDVPLYLRCTDENVPFVQNNGFDINKRFFLQPNGDATAEPFPLNGMVHVKQEQLEV